MKHSKQLVLLALFSACQSSVEQQKAPTETVAADTISTKATTAQPIVRASAPSTKSTNDTLQVSNNLVLRILPGSKTDFPELPTEPKKEITEAYLIRQQADGRVRREGSKLLLTLDNGKSIVLKNDSYQSRGDENEELDKSYQYQGNLCNLPYWLVAETLYEAHHTLLINQQTGVKTAFNGDLEVSPDHTRLLASYAGMVYDDDVSTIQLFAIEQRATPLLWQKNLLDWAPIRTHWLDNQTIAVEQLRLDSDSASVTHSTYIRLKLP